MAGNRSEKMVVQRARRRRLSVAVAAGLGVAGAVVAPMAHAQTRLDWDPTQGAGDPFGNGISRGGSGSWNTIDEVWGNLTNVGQPIGTYQAWVNGGTTATSPIATFTIASSEELNSLTLTEDIRAQALDFRVGGYVIQDPAAGTPRTLTVGPFNHPIAGQSIGGTIPASPNTLKVRVVAQHTAAPAFNVSEGTLSFTNVTSNVARANDFSSGFAAGATFNLSGSGVLRAVGGAGIPGQPGSTYSSLNGVKTINLNGGTFQAVGPVTAQPGSLEERYFDYPVPTNATAPTAAQYQSFLRPLENPTEVAYGTGSVKPTIATGLLSQTPVFTGTIGDDDENVPLSFGTPNANNATVALNARSGAKIGGDHLAALYRGKITVTQAGVYSFGLRNSGGGVIYVDINGDGQFNTLGHASTPGGDVQAGTGFGPTGEQIVNNNPTRGTTTAQGAIGAVNLPVGEYDFAIGYFHATGTSILEARYAYQGLAANNNPAFVPVTPTNSTVTNPLGPVPYTSQTPINPSTIAAHSFFSSVSAQGASFAGTNFFVQDLANVASTIVVDAESANFGNLDMANTSVLNLQGAGSLFAEFTGLTGHGSIQINTNQNTKISGPVTGVVDPNVNVPGFVKGGFGVLNLNANNNPTIAGIIRVQAGALAVGADGALGTIASPTQIQNGAQLQIRANYTLAEPVTLTGTGTNPSTIVEPNPDYDPNDPGETDPPFVTVQVAASNGALESTGTAAESRTFAGVITVEGDGALFVSDLAAGATAHTLTLTGGITGGSQRDLMFGGTGTIVIAGAALTGSGSGAEIRKVDAGTLRIENANPGFTGVANVDNGVLQIANVNALQGVTDIQIRTQTVGTVVNPGVLETSVGGINLSLVDALNPISILRLTADQGGGAPSTPPTNPFLGTVEVNGTQSAGFNLRMANGSTIRAINGTQTHAANLLVTGTMNVGGNTNATLNLTGAINNDGANVGNVLKFQSPTNSDTVVFSNANNYTGTTTVRSGILRANAAGAFGPTAGAAGKVTVFGGGTIEASATDALRGKTVEVGQTGTLRLTTPNTTPFGTGGQMAAVTTTGGTIEIQPGVGNNVVNVGAVSLNRGTVRAVNGVADFGANAIIAQPVGFNTTPGLLARAVTTGPGTPTNAAAFQAILNATPAAETVLDTESLDFANDAAFSNFFGISLVDNFNAVFRGNFTAPTAGTYTFRRTNNDDAAALAVDRNNNGLYTDDAANFFSASTGNGQTGDIALTLAANETIGVAWILRENGGGSSIKGWFSEPAATGTFTIVNPSGQGTRFTTVTQTGGGTIELMPGVGANVPGSQIRAGSIGNVSEVILNGALAPANAPTLQLGAAAGSAATSSASRLVVVNTAAPVANLEIAGTHVFSVSNLNMATNATLNKQGTGTLNITGTGTGNGSGGAPTGTLSILAGTLSGTGSIAGSVAVFAGARLAPGSSPGTLDIAGRLDVERNATYAVEIAGRQPGDAANNYDQTNVTGVANLGITSGPDANIGANLSAVLVNFMPSPTDVFYILSRGAGSNPVTFAGVPEGGTVTLFPGVTGQVTYAANWDGTQAGSSLTGGNDIAIFNVVPEPGSLGALAVGAAGLLARRRRRS